MKMGISDYKELAETIEADAFQSGYVISVLVEDIYDQRFWECLIENVKPSLKDKINFPHPTPTGTRGKNILENYKNFVNKKLIICIDSDCEYLHNNKVWYVSEYIYNTVAYSKENFQCNHFSLSKICKSLTTKNYDFENLLKNISQIISPLFYVWLYFKENKRKKSDYPINSKDFEKVLGFQDSLFQNIGDEDILFKSIEDRVRDTLQDLKNAIDNDSWYDSIFETDIPDIKNRLIEQYSIHPENILAFCYGHCVLDKFVTPFMTKLIEILKNSKIEEVRQALSEDRDIENTISRIKNMAKLDIKTKLSDSFNHLIYGTTENHEIQKIKNKLDEELN
jgi:hypothetical protein